LTRRDVKAARRFFQQAIGTTKATPVEVVTDRAAIYLILLEELLPAAWHRTEQYANNRVEADHGRLKSRLDRCEGSSRTQRQGDHPRAWVRPQPSARSRRAGRGGTSDPAADRRVRRTRSGDLILYGGRCFSAPRPD